MVCPLEFKEASAPGFGHGHAAFSILTSKSTACQLSAQMLHKRNFWYF